MADCKAFGAMLAGMNPGLSPEVAAAWCQCEGGPDDNPLNIGPGKHFGSMQDAARAVTHELSTPLYVGIASTFGVVPPYVRAGEGNTEKELARINYNKAQIRAIGDSPWCYPKVCEIYRPGDCVENAMVDFLLDDPEFWQNVPQGTLAPGLADQALGSGSLSAMILEKLLALFGIESITEAIIRLLEIAGGAALLAIAVTMFMDIVSRAGGDPRGAIGRSVKKGARLIPYVGQVVGSGKA